jgi:hypothetical protein
MKLYAQAPEGMIEVLESQAAAIRRHCSISLPGGESTRRPLFMRYFDQFNALFTLSRMQIIYDRFGWPQKLPSAIKQYGGAIAMTVKIIIFLADDGFNVLVSGQLKDVPMRVRSFDNRATMLALLENLHLICPEDVQNLEEYKFLNSCPVYSAEIDEEMLEAHGFHKP